MPWPGEKRAHDEDLAVEMFLGDRPCCADRTLAAESEEALQVGIGAHEVECGAAGLVDVFSHAIPVADQLHIGGIGFDISDRCVRPGVVKGHRQGANENRIFAFAAERLGEAFAVSLAEALGGGELEVIVGVLLLGRFVRDDLDASRAGALEHGLQNFCVVGHHADHVDLLGDQVLYGAHLQGGGRRLSGQS